MAYPCTGGRASPRIRSGGDAHVFVPPDFLDDVLIFGLHNVARKDLDRLVLRAELCSISYLDISVAHAQVRGHWNIASVNNVCT